MTQPQTTGEDRFVAGTLRILAWAQRNTRALVLGIGAAAILIFAVKYYVDYRQRLNVAAASELRAIHNQLQMGNPDQVVDPLRAFLVQFSNTRYAREARVLLAHSLLLGNRASEAIEPARQAMDALEDDILSLRAGFLLGAAYEEAGDTAAAIGVYEQIGATVDFRVQRTRALESAARLHAARGDLDRAADVYDELSELTPPEAPARSFYQMRAAELRARAARGPQES
jgi:predicted negative regulator of RcsB-dependent stress response